MPTAKFNAPAIRPQDDTRHEGLQAALDILFDRRRALDALFAEATAHRDTTRMQELDTRIGEVSGAISAIRAIDGGAA